MDKSNCYTENLIIWLTIPVSITGLDDVQQAVVLYNGRSSGQGLRTVALNVHFQQITTVSPVHLVIGAFDR